MASITGYTKAGVDTRLARKAAVRPRATNPLDIPTYDGNPNVAHPSVALAPGGSWNGYRYWMGFTPYPGEPRENPSVIASHDGVHWEVPAGLTNPIRDLAWAESVSGAGAYNADTHILFDGDTLHLYWRAGNDLYRSSSTDGVTWSTPVLSMTGTANGAELSPAVVKMADGTWHLWTVNAVDLLAPFIEHRTGTDGLTWGTPTVSYLPPGVLAWHIDVQWADDRFHMLVHDKATEGRSFLTYVSSTDGDTWTGDTGFTMPPSGEAWDAYGVYRSCMVPRPGRPLTWDVWVNGFIDPTAMRIGYIEGYDWVGEAARERSHRATRAVTKQNRMAVVDGFERAWTYSGLGSPDIGAEPWLSHGAAVARIANGEAFMTTGYFVTTPGVKDGVIRCEVNIGSGTQDGGIVFRAGSDAENFNVQLYKDSTYNWVRLRLRTDGANTTLATTTAAGLVEGISDLEVAYRGRDITVKVNGVEKLTYTLAQAHYDLMAANTRVGVHASTSTFRFKNFINSTR